MGELLQVKDLAVSFASEQGLIRAVRGVNFSLNQGEIIAIVGESGCGKSVTAQGIMGLIPAPSGYIERGEIFFQGRDLLCLEEKEMNQVRGKKISMIFQDPMSSLNPLMKVGKQIMESLSYCCLSRRDEVHKTLEIMRLVELPQPEKRFKQYPHELSGGMRQRVMIAMALAAQPKLLIADEPTTSLDVTIQAQIMQLLKDIKAKTNTSIILITHDLGIVAGIASRVLVMYAGQIVEEGPVRDIFYQPRHPYTQSLLKSLPRMNQKRQEKLQTILGQPPDLFRVFKGCAFAPRCATGMKGCWEQAPQFYRFSPDRGSACWLEHPQAGVREKRLAKFD